MIRLAAIAALLLACGPAAPTELPERAVLLWTFDSPLVAGCCAQCWAGLECPLQNGAALELPCDAEPGAVGVPEFDDAGELRRVRVLP